MSHALAAETLRTRLFPTHILRRATRLPFFPTPLPQELRRLPAIRCYCHCGLPEPRGTSHTSFPVHLPDLRIKVTVAFEDFPVFGRPVNLVRLRIGFLSVRPRFRHCFFAPGRHRLKLANRYEGGVGNQAPRGLPQRMYDVPVIPKKRLCRTLDCRHCLPAINTQAVTTLPYPAGYCRRRRPRA